MAQAAMRDESPVCQRDLGREHIEIWRDGEEGAEKPQVPRHARFVKEGRNGAGRHDVCWGGGH
jgi:hypothetical protein